MSRIEQLINEIEEYIDGCKPQPFTNNRKIVVDKDEIEELLAELRLRTPDEIKKYQKIIANRDEIINTSKEEASVILSSAKEQSEGMLSSAQSRSEQMLNDANMQVEQIMEEVQRRSAELVSENEVMQQAYQQANEVIAMANAQAQQIVDDAVAESNGIRESAIRYTDEMLGGLQSIVLNALQDSNKTFSAFAGVLQATSDVISQNRNELQGAQEPEGIEEIEEVEFAEESAPEAEDGGLSADML